MFGVLRRVEQDHGAASGRIKDRGKEFGIGVEFFQVAGTELSGLYPNQRRNSLLGAASLIQSS